MNSVKIIALGLFLSSALSGCLDMESQTQISDPSTIDESFNWNIPKGMPLPVVPEDNPPTEEKYQLGRHLFYDTRLSGNNTMSCASCHFQHLAFSDGKARPFGITGQVHPRNSQGLVNVSYFPTLNWANTATTTLELQAPVPIFGDSPVELGVDESNSEEVLSRIRSDQTYQELFADAFPDEEDPYQFTHMIKAIATFVRGINSFNSEFDKYSRGEPNTMSDSAKRGMALFNGERLECFHCHAGINFSTSHNDRSQRFAVKDFFNNGLYNLDDKGSYPEGGEGLFEMTQKYQDMGKFRPPSLRNIELTAPYMHDGSIATLEEVLDHYSRGGTLTEVGPNAGDGRLNPNKSSDIVSFEITVEEKQDVINFLKSLTDYDLINNPRFSNPFEEE